MILCCNITVACTHNVAFRTDEPSLTKQPKTENYQTLDNSAFFCASGIMDFEKGKNSIHSIFRKSTTSSKICSISDEKKERKGIDIFSSFDLKKLKFILLKAVDQNKQLKIHHFIRLIHS